MSGVKRKILADITKRGLTGKAALAQLSPDKIRAEGTCTEEVY